MKLKPCKTDFVKEIQTETETQAVIEKGRLMESDPNSMSAGELYQVSTHRLIKLTANLYPNYIMKNPTNISSQPKIFCWSPSIQFYLIPLYVWKHNIIATAIKESRKTLGRTVRFGRKRVVMNFDLVHSEHSQYCENVVQNCHQFSRGKDGKHMIRFNVCCLIPLNRNPEPWPIGWRSLMPYYREAYLRATIKWKWLAASRRQ